MRDYGKGMIGKEELELLWGFYRLLNSAASQIKRYVEKKRRELGIEKTDIESSS